jgi:hypothetical protein
MIVLATSARSAVPTLDLLSSETLAVNFADENRDVVTLYIPSSFNDTDGRNSIFGQQWLGNSSLYYRSTRVNEYETVIRDLCTQRLHYRILQSDSYFLPLSTRARFRDYLLDLGVAPEVAWKLFAASKDLGELVEAADKLGRPVASALSAATEASSAASKHVSFLSIIGLAKDVIDLAKTEVEAMSILMVYQLSATEETLARLNQLRTVLGSVGSNDASACQEALNRVDADIREMMALPVVKAAWLALREKAADLTLGAASVAAAVSSAVATAAGSNPIGAAVGIVILAVRITIDVYEQDTLAQQSSIAATIFKRLSPAASDESLMNYSYSQVLYFEYQVQAVTLPSGELLDFFRKYVFGNRQPDEVKAERRSKRDTALALVPSALIEAPSILVGSFSNPMVLTRGNSPFRIQGNVSFDRHLVAEPGVEVIVDGNFSITANWITSLEGSSNAPIRFRPATPATGSPAWSGLTFKPAIPALPQRVSNTRIEGAATGMAFTEGDIGLKHLLLEHCGTGLFFASGDRTRTASVSKVIFI